MEAKDYTILRESEEISVYNLKLTEEIVEKLLKGQKNFDDLVGVEFVLSNTDKGINKLKIGQKTFQFSKVKETQAIHLLANPKNTSKLFHLGSINEKLNPKLELEASKAEAIRHRSQEAEKERLSRKTVELDAASTHNLKQNQKRLINRRPSITSTRSTTPSTISNATSSSNNNTAKQQNYSLRTRSIQVLALGPHSQDQLLVKLNATSNQLTPVLQDICLNPSNTLNLNLRPEVFEEVKLADWPFYSIRERDIVSKNISLNQISDAATPPETPETPSPKKQIFSSNFVPSNRSLPGSVKKSVTAKDRLTAIMKRRR